MLSFEECKKILNSEEKQYTDQEIIEIRDILNQLAKADVNLFKQIQYEGREKGNNLFKGIDN